MERERLVPEETVRAQNVRDIRTQITELEHQVLAPARRRLARAQATQENPPMDDLGLLADLAPMATEQITRRIGLQLMALHPELAFTPHGAYLRAGVELQLHMAGYQDHVKAEMLSKLSPGLARAVEAAPEPPAGALPRFVPEYRGERG